MQPAARWSWRKLLFHESLHVVQPVLTWFPPLLDQVLGPRDAALHGEALPRLWLPSGIAPTIRVLRLNRHPEESDCRP